MFFTWIGYELSDDSLCVLQFYNCVLTKDVGGFKEGTQFKMIRIDFENLKIGFHENINDMPIYTCDFSLETL